MINMLLIVCIHLVFDWRHTILYLWLWPDGAFIHSCFLHFWCYHLCCVTHSIHTNRFIHLKWGNINNLRFWITISQSLPWFECHCWLLLFVWLIQCIALVWRSESFFIVTIFWFLDAVAFSRHYEGISICLGLVSEIVE